MNIENCELETLLVCSFRYALGRRSYIVSDVAYLILVYKDVLHQNTKELITDEIRLAISSGEAGMDCDIVEWLNVYGELIDE